MRSRSGPTIQAVADVADDEVLLNSAEVKLWLSLDDDELGDLVTRGTLTEVPSRAGLRPGFRAEQVSKLAVQRGRQRK
jgi:hypothetical protein